MRGGVDGGKSRKIQNVRTAVGMKQKRAKGREGHGESDSSMGRAIWDKRDRGHSRREDAAEFGAGVQQVMGQHRTQA